jgi:hypothetical protein
MTAPVRDGPDWRLMKTRPQTARSMHRDGPPAVPLGTGASPTFAGRYLRGAWLVADGDIAAAGHGPRALTPTRRLRGLLVETGQNDRDTAQHRGTPSRHTARTAGGPGAAGWRQRRSNRG